MPIYEYVCSKCGDHLEVIQKMDDKPLTRCAKCKGKLAKAISRSSFAFKGSGWYVTDYAKSGSAAAESKSKEESSSKGESSSTGDASAKSDSSSKSDSAPAKSDTPTPAASTSGKTKSD